MSEEALSKQQKYQLVQEDYDGTVEYYHANYNAAEEFRTQLADFLMSLPQHAVVLDSGSGPGKEASVIAQSAQQVIVLDLSAKMLEKVKGTNPLIETVQANMREIPLPTSSLDAIWCSRAIIHIPHEDLIQTLTSFHRVLKPGGVLGLIFHIPDEDVLLKEEFLPETAPNSEGLVYYRNLYADAYMSEMLTLVGFTIEKKEPGVSKDNEIILYMRARERM
jgi:ubiquinone/menaquinone biosynthesis C-methylase UbiE